MSSNIWAVGDVTDRMNLTPVAIREAQAFAETVFYNKPSKFEYDAIPTAVFSQPPVGVVGMTEAEARHEFGKVDVYMTRFRPMKYAFAGSDDRVLMKAYRGAEIRPRAGLSYRPGPRGPEVIQLAAIAVKAGLTKAQWDATCALHPSVSEELVTLREKHEAIELSAA